MKSGGQHWDEIFSTTRDEKLGWYERDLSQTFKLLGHISSLNDSTIFIPGAGTSVLIDKLLEKGARLVLNDISQEALDKVKSRLGNRSNDIVWLCQDMSLPVIDVAKNIDIWIDRAVLHFLTDKADIRGYFANLKSLLTVGGYAIFAEFSKVGVSKCAGLDVHQYSIEEFSNNLGSSFKLVAHFNYVYTNPGGDPRPYIYALFMREK